MAGSALRNADARVLPDGDVGHGAGCQLLPAGICQATPAGSMPSVDPKAAARELVATQDHNPFLEMDTLPFDRSYGAAQAAHAARSHNDNGDDDGRGR